MSQTTVNQPVSLSMLDGHLTDREFLDRHSRVVGHSPLLWAFYVRLGKAVDQQTVEALSNSAECPVCQAQLTVDVDVHSNKYTLET